MPASGSRPRLLAGLAAEEGGITITIEGRNEFGEVCRKQIQTDNSWERLLRQTYFLYLAARIVKQEP
jgi:hypothetical protein